MTPEPEALEAWVLPPGSPDPPGLRDFEVEGRTVRHPAPDGPWVGAVARRLREATEAVRALPWSEVATALGAVGARFLDPDDPLRAEALAFLPATAGLSREMAEAVLDGMARDWTEARLREFVEAELEDPGALDGFVPGRGARRRVRALGPALSFQVASGSVPGVGATAVVRGLLAKGAVLAKPGRGDVVLPVLLARAIAESHPVLARAVAVAYWPGGRESAVEAEEAALSLADVVVAYGGDEAVSLLAGRAPATTRFVGYHHRVSVGLVGREALAADRVGRTASEVAGAVAFFDQRGCVSPHTIWVEEGGEETPRRFAARLAEAMASLEELLPGGRLDASEASAVHQLRGVEELRIASGAEGVEIHHGGRTFWTVIHDPDPVLRPGCVGRVVRVAPVAALGDVVERIRPLGRHLQTVGLAGAEDRAETLAAALGRAGASRITGFADMAFPPPWWHHDGRGGLSVLLRWVDLDPS